MGAPPAMGRARVSTPGCFVHILHARTRHQVHATPFEMDDRGTQYVANVLLLLLLSTVPSIALIHEFHRQSRAKSRRSDEPSMSAKSARTSANSIARTRKDTESAPIGIGRMPVVNGNFGSFADFFARFRGLTLTVPGNREMFILFRAFIVFVIAFTAFS